MPKKGPKAKARGPPPPVPSRGEIPSAEQLMDRLALNHNPPPPPVPVRGGGKGDRGQVQNAPPIPNRDGVPTAEQLMNRMDEMKQESRRKKKKKKKQKKGGLKLPSAYDFSYKRAKAAVYIKPKAKDSTVADWEFGDRTKMSKNVVTKARKKAKEKDVTLKKRRSGNKKLPTLEVRTVVEINNEFAEKRLRQVIIQVENSRDRLFLEREITHAVSVSQLKFSNPVVVQAQELRNRLLAEETRRKNALLKLIESTERAKKTRVIGDLVECIDEAIDAGNPEEHEAVIEARRVLDELEREAIRLAAAERRLEVAVEQVRENRNRRVLEEELKIGLEAGLKRDVHPVVEQAETLIRELLEHERKLAKAMTALKRATDDTYNLLQQTTVKNRKSALQESVAILRQAIAAFEQLETGSPELMRATSVADMADKEIARLQKFEDEFSRSVEQFRAWWEARKQSNNEQDDDVAVGEKKDELTKLLKDAIDRGIPDNCPAVLSAKQLLKEFQSFLNVHAGLVKMIKAARDALADMSVWGMFAKKVQAKLPQLTQALGAFTAGDGRACCKTAVEANALIVQLQEAILMCQANTKLQSVVSEVALNLHDAKFYSQMQTKLTQALEEGLNPPPQPEAKPGERVPPLPHHAPAVEKARKLLEQLKILIAKHLAEKNLKDMEDLLRAAIAEAEKSREWLPLEEETTACVANGLDDDSQVVADAQDMIVLLKKEKELEAQLQAAIDAAKEKTGSGDEGGEVDAEVCKEAAETLQNEVDSVLVAGLREASPVIAVAKALIARLLAAATRQMGKNAALEALRKAIATAREDRKSSPLQSAYDVVMELCTTTVNLSGNMTVQQKRAGPSRGRKNTDTDGKGEKATSAGEVVSTLDPAAVPLTREAELLLQEISLEALLKEATEKTRTVLKEVDLSVETMASESTASITASLDSLQEVLASALNGDGVALQPTNPNVVSAEATVKDSQTALAIVKAVADLRSRIQTAEKCWETAKRPGASSDDQQAVTVAMAELKTELEKALGVGVGHHFPVVLDARKLLTAFDDAMDSEAQLERERRLKARLIAACNSAEETRLVKPLESELASVLADPDANEDWQEVADTRDLIALLRKEGELKQRLNAAIEKAQRDDDEIDVATAPKAYKQAIDTFSASIVECVGEGLLPETHFTAVTARKLEATMLSKLQTVIENAKQVLRKAISTAVVTRESAPLATCLDKLVNTDELFREACDDVIQIAENLLKEIREEEAKKAAALKALKHSNDLAEKALECSPDSIFDAIGRVFPTPIEDHLASALFAEVKEDHPEVLRAQSLIAKMKEVLKSIEEARARLAEATVTAEQTREIAPLDSALDASLAAGVPHNCKEVVDARALLATLLAEADADARKRLLEQLHQRLQKAIDAAQVSREWSPLQAELDACVAAGLAQDSQAAADATDLIVLLKKEKELEAQLQAAIDAAKEKTKPDSDGNSKDVELFKEASTELQGTLDSVLAAGLRPASPVVTAAKQLLAALQASIEGQVSHVLLVLQHCTDRVRETRERPELEAALHITLDFAEHHSNFRDAVLNSDEVAAAKQLIAELIQEEKDAAAAAERLRLQNEAREQLRAACLVATSTRDPAPLKALIEDIVVTRAILPEEDEDVVAARALVAQLEEEARRQAEAVALLQSAIDKVEQAEHVVLMQRFADSDLLPQLKHTLAAGVLREHPVVIAAEALLLKVEQATLALAAAEERLKESVELASTYQMTYQVLEQELQIGLDAGLDAKYHDVVPEAEELIARLKEEEANRLQAEEELRRVIAEVRISREADKLARQVDEALSWGVQEGSAVVIEARELLQAIADERYWAAVRVQTQVRRWLAAREAERRRREREAEIASIFGDLGNAFKQEVNTSFKHSNSVESSTFSESHKRLKHIYTDDEELEKAHRVATKVQAYARRFLDRRSYVTLLKTEMKRLDTDGNHYTYNEFVDLYGGDVEWEEALLATYSPEVNVEEPKPRRRGRTMQRRETRRALGRKNTKAVIRAETTDASDAEHKRSLTRKFTRKRTVRGIEPRQRRRYGQKQVQPSPEELLWAAEENDVETIQILLDAGTPVDCLGDDDFTPLLLAVNFSSAEAAQMLLQYGANINHVGSDGSTPVILASYNGNAQLLDVLLNPDLEAKIDIDARYGEYGTSLCLSAQEGHLDCCQKLIAAKASINMTDDSGSSPLYLACHASHEDIVAVLCEQPDIKPEQGNDKGITPLYVAAEHSLFEAAKLLLNLGADPEHHTHHGSTPVDVALFTGHLPTCSLLFDYGVSPTYCRRSDNSSAMMLAGFPGHWEIVVDIFKRGGDLLAQNKHGDTLRDIVEQQHDMALWQTGLPDEEALFIAAEENNVELIDKLLALETSVNCINDDKFTPLMLASYFGSTDTVNKLLDHGAGATVNNIGNDGSTALILASFGGHVEVCSTLIKRCTDPVLDQTIALKQGATALYMACQENRTEIVSVLATPAVVNVTCGDGVTPLYISAHEGNADIMKFLLDAKANTNAVNNNGVSPLFIAVQKCHPHACDLLLEYKANPNLLTEKGASPLAIAVFHCHPTLVKHLLIAGAKVDQGGELELMTKADKKKKKSRRKKKKEKQTGNFTTEAMLAAASGDVDILQTLLTFGASCNLLDKSESNVDDIVRKKHHHTLAEIVETHFHDKNHIDDETHEEYLRKARAAFNSLDGNGSGSVSLAEFTEYLREAGQEKHHKHFEKFAEQEFQRINYDEDGGISFEEFKTCFTRIDRLRRAHGQTALLEAGEHAEEGTKTQSTKARVKTIVRRSTGKDMLESRKIKFWRTLFLAQNDDGTWPIEMEEREGLANIKHRPSEDKKWLFIEKVDKPAAVCGFEVGDVIMEMGSEYQIPHSLMQFSIITKDHGFSMVQVYRPSLDAAV